MDHEIWSVNQGRKMIKSINRLNEYSEKITIVLQACAKNFSHREFFKATYTNTTFDQLYITRIVNERDEPMHNL
jgi:hypothetical protein